MNNFIQQLDLFPSESVGIKEKTKQKLDKVASNVKTLQIMRPDGTTFSVPIARLFVCFSLFIMCPILIPISCAMYSKSNNQQEFIIKIIHGYDPSHSNISDKKVNKIG